MLSAQKALTRIIQPITSRVREAGGRIEIALQNPNPALELVIEASIENFLKPYR